MEDDVPECRTVTEPHCDEAGEHCVTLGREECRLERRRVVKTTPLTGCDKVARLLCSNPGCRRTEGPVQCREEPRTAVVERPVEDCRVSPVRVCRPVTRMVPRLEPTQAGLPS